MVINARVRVRPRVGPWLAVLISATFSPLAPADLTLARAESLAWAADPAVERLQAEQAALGELSVAAGELPDPVARLGVMSLPTDGFELGREPMTQLLAGVVQRFPRGLSRQLERRQMQERATAMGLLADEQRLQTVRAVRERYLEVMLYSKLLELTESAREVFADLEEITREYHETGRGQLQDVLQASVELGRIDERAGRFRQTGREARSGLAVYIGPAAFGALPHDWPDLPAVEPEALLFDALAAHPRIQALRQDAVAAETGVALAEQRYRPEVAVDLSYGFRSGSDAQGVSRPDLVSAMLLVDLPLFHDNRQDRVRAARLAQSSAAAFARDDTYRRMEGELRSLLAAREEVAQRRVHFESVLLPKASFSAAASFDAYRSAVGDLTDVLRARITEYELGLDHVRVVADALRIQAQLLYLHGEAS